MRILGLVLFKAAAWLLPGSCRELDRKLVDTYQNYKRSVRPHLSPLLIAALIGAEDRRFYAHSGVDPFAIMRAFYMILLKRQIMGASTIEQQLVRTLTGRYERRLGRKIREILLATRVTVIIPKREIPGVYLSVAYFGWGMNGVKQACERLGLQMGSLSLRQAASIVARLKYPEPQVAPVARTLQIAVRTDYIMRLLERPDSGLVPSLEEDLADGAVFDY